MKLSLNVARQLSLAAQGLLHPVGRPADRTDVLAAIRRMGALQIDTIHVIARSPYLVLWSRLGDYKKEWLDEWLAEGALFEYWSHAACFLPIEDYPLYRQLMLHGLKGWKNSHAWLEQHPKLVENVLTRIRKQGAVRSSDFQGSSKPPGGWWNWKEEKMALEHLYNIGTLMIARRERFQRVYDLRERVLPPGLDQNLPDVEQVQVALTEKAIKAMGITLPQWVADYFRLSKRDTAQALRALQADGRILPVQVEGWESPAYIHASHRSLAEKALKEGLQPRVTTFLSPFDPLIWDRERARVVFDFDYRLECYLPAPKRRYGYFVLPILHHDRLIGRMDPKAHRKEGIFEIRSLSLEAGIDPDEAMVSDVADTLKRFAAWHGTPQVLVRKTEPAEIVNPLQRSLRSTP
jgi:uncharacterized protein YcaQ